MMWSPWFLIHLVTISALADVVADGVNHLRSSNPVQSGDLQYISRHLAQTSSPTLSAAPLAQAAFAPVTPYPTAAPAPTAPVNCRGLSNVMTVNLGYYDSSGATTRSCKVMYPKNIDVSGNRYTHLAYAFTGINASDQIGPSGDDYVGQVPMYLQFNALKRTHPSLKTLISVGDGILGYASFSEIAAAPSRRANFGASVVSFLKKYGFDGVDIDWEFPGDFNGRPADVKNFPLLLKAIRDASFAASKQILITIAISVDKAILKAGYNLTALSKQVDFFNVMAYDVNGIWNDPPVIGANTDMPSIKSAIRYMLQKGVPSNKMVFGLAAYGNGFYLADPNCNEPNKGCNFITPDGPPGCGGDKGSLPDFTINHYIQRNTYNALRFNPKTVSMELVTGGNVWISFDNPKTFNMKASYAAAACMRGTMWWSVDQVVSPIVLNALKPA